MCRSGYDVLRQCFVSRTSTCHISMEHSVDLGTLRLDRQCQKPTHKDHSSSLTGTISHRSSSSECMFVRAVFRRDKVAVRTSQEFQDSSSVDRGDVGRSASDTTVDPNQSRVLSALSNLMHHPKEPPPTSSESNRRESLVYGSSFEVRTTLSIFAAADRCDHRSIQETRRGVRFR